MGAGAGPSACCRTSSARSATGRSSSTWASAAAGRCCAAPRDGDDMSAAFLDDDDVLTGLIAVGRPDDLAAARELVPRARVSRRRGRRRRAAVAECRLEHSAGDGMTGPSRRAAGCEPQEWHEVTAPPAGSRRPPGAGGRLRRRGARARRALPARRGVSPRGRICGSRSSYQRSPAPPLPAAVRGSAARRLGAQLDAGPGDRFPRPRQPRTSPSRRCRDRARAADPRSARPSIERELCPGGLQHGPPATSTRSRRRAASPP